MLFVWISKQKSQFLLNTIIHISIMFIHYCAKINYEFCFQWLNRMRTCNTNSMIIQYIPNTESYDILISDHVQVQSKCDACWYTVDLNAVILRDNNTQNLWQKNPPKNQTNKQNPQLMKLLSAVSYSDYNFILVVFWHVLIPPNIGFIWLIDWLCLA